MVSAGEHFAFCVEYVLLFSPIARARNLMTSKQVTNRTVQSGSQAPQIGEENHVSIAIEVEKGGVLIKSLLGKNSKIVIPETCEQSLVDPTEDMVATCNHLQELMTQREGEAEIEGDALLLINESRQSSSENIGKRKRKLLRKMQRRKNGNGVTATIGEFDFLFEHAVEQDCELCFQAGIERNRPSQAHQEMRVNHWEVSVKFLLYAGPWEVFGFQTPRYAAWHCLSQEGKDEVVCQQGMGLQHKDTTCSVEVCELSQKGWHANAFLGWFLGPHVGETLYNRKTRLINQLALSQNVHAASLLCHVFGSRSNGKITSSSPSDDSSLDEILCTSSDQYDGEAIEKEHAELLRVFPRAFLKGYLFYEYDLWCQLYPRETWGQGVNHSPKILNSKTRNSVGDLSHEASVNPEHWTGWWTRVQNFANFARLPAHERSKWYIVPKLEWLSPVVIDGEDETRVQQVLSLEEFLIVAEKVAEEAEKTNISRKRRFMVAEVVWETLNSAFDQRPLRREVYVESGKGLGRWTEVSRGFVVEDTWPDSRVYRPHGYRLSSLP